MSIFDNKILIEKICDLYYRRNYTQAQIGKLLNVSRPQVSRVLSYALEKGIVEIKINGMNIEEQKLEDDLIDQFGLNDVYIVDTLGFKGEEEIDYLASQSAEYVAALMPNRGTVGIMSGRSIFGIAKHLPRESTHQTFVPLVGGMVSQGYEWFANYICMRLAEKTGGHALSLNAPAIVSSEEVRDLLIEEPYIKNVVDVGRTADVALLGIGEVTQEASSSLAENLNAKEVKDLQESGAYAAVAISFLNREGKIVDNFVSKRSIGVQLDELKTNKKIAVACGSEKIDCIRATIQSGYIDFLVTSQEVAKSLVNK